MFFHIKAMKALGATIKVEKGFIHAFAKDGLHGAVGVLMASGGGIGALGVAVVAIKAEGTNREVVGVISTLLAGLAA